MEGIVHDGDAGSGNHLALLICKLAQTLLGNLGGEDGAEGLQQIAHGFGVEDNGILTRGGNVAAQLAKGGFGSLLGQRFAVQLIQLPQLDLVIVGLFRAVRDHGGNHQTGDGVLVVQVQTTGVIDGEFAALGDALGGAAVDDRGIGGKDGLLSSEDLLDEFLSRGQGIILKGQLGIALAAFAQKFGIAGLQRFCVVHAPLNQRGGLIRVHILGGCVAHLAVHETPQAHAALGGAGELVQRVLECTDGGGFRSLVV